MPCRHILHILDKYGNVNLAGLTADRLVHPYWFIEYADISKTNKNHQKVLSYFGQFKYEGPIVPESYLGWLENETEFEIEEPPAVYRVTNWPREHLNRIVGRPSEDAVHKNGMSIQQSMAFGMSQTSVVFDNEEDLDEIESFLENGLAVDRRHRTSKRNTEETRTFEELDPLLKDTLSLVEKDPEMIQEVKTKIMQLNADIEKRIQEKYGTRRTRMV